MKQLILHIPHSSTIIPTKEGCVVDNSVLDEEIMKLTDWYTDDLFRSANEITVKADFSRIFCDPERFIDDDKEIMSKFGMGVLYKKSDDGKSIRKIVPTLRKKIIDGYYWPHHHRLSEAVKDQLTQYSEATIIECHSFSDTPFMRDLDQSHNRPDFCLGTDQFHTPNNYITASVQYFESQGYIAEINRPYQGSIVPLEYYQSNKSVRSIMLEVNRKLYTTDGANEKSDKYMEIKSVVQDYLKLIKNI